MPLAKKIANTIIPQKIVTMWILIISLFNTMNCMANEHAVSEQMLADIDQQHQQVMHTFYRSLLKQPYYKTQKYPSLSALQTQLQKISDDDEIKQTALIINNINMLKDYYYEPEFFTLTEHLLDANLLNEAQQLIDAVIEQDDASLSAQANYLLAEFYFQRQQWQQTLNHLNGDINLLAVQSLQHALLMKGISYQKQGKHSLAIKMYEVVPETSPYFITAQLNLAVADIKQGWWTDAHVIIKQLLAKPSIKNDEATSNRLYVTLGYSLLNQGYFRTARSSFQQVSIDSKYTNQAILGIVLTAAQQNDDIGALNATRALKQKDQEELPVYESHLLMPFLYEKTHQLGTASMGYSKAINYYQDKVNELERIIAKPLPVDPISNELAATELTTFQALNIDLTQHYPENYFRNRRAIQAYLPYMREQKLLAEYNLLYTEYQQLSDTMHKDILQQRVDKLNSYLNQSRYGLARLFDNNTAEK